jgi:hypothetical protein
MPVASPDIVTLAILTEIVSRGAGTMVLITGVLAGCFRAGAVLRRATSERVEWLTAVGFACGVIVTILLVCVDKVLQGG